MKRHELIQYLKKQGCVFEREGTRHTRFRNPKNNEFTVVPRHTEIDNRLCNKICKDLEIPKIR